MDRIALVIGNSNYNNVNRLNNPHNDATDIASILKKVNFDVTVLLDYIFRRDKAIVTEK